MGRGTPDAEEALENAVLVLFASLGWKTANAYYESHTPATNTQRSPYLGRETRGEVVLRPRLEAALARLNPELPSEALRQAVEELTRDRSAMSMVEANRQIYGLLKEGIPVSFRGRDGEERAERVWAVDWDEPANNEFLMVQQLWVTGEVYTRRADLVGFVNGLPLLFGELKAHHRRLQNAYNLNLSDYKDTIPQIFWYNAFLVLSNGSDSVMGTITSGWEYLAAWKKINSEGETGIISLDTMVRGSCEPVRFLDIVENFVLYQQTRGGLAKIVSLYYQYLGVNNALDAVQQMRENRGRLGVFWHTQGSGKSFSMIFFCQKVLRKLPGHWTFVIVTDRLDLDDQIYKNFASTGVITESEHRVRAESGSGLQRLLSEDHRYVFTLIQKFHAARGARHPQISDRDDIIVITDEAHRSQYDVLAMNMHDALPNAAFIGFTATPLIVGEEKTREVFGDYVSVYTYKQSNEDRSTVPLYYENRIPELEVINEEFDDDMSRLLEGAELDDDQESALAREFAREYHLITRDDRLERIAEDIVQHFTSRGYLGKAMVVSIDKVTTVRMYDKVRKYWDRTLATLRTQLAAAIGEDRVALAARIAFMETTDMAVVVSEEQNEVKKFRDRGLDIIPHRRRIKTETLDDKFKDPNDPFRLVFVCAMWRTGFDAPSCSTIYLDRPMQNHTLMQTIARANRVFGAKVNGLIVDYVGIFRYLQQALAIYGTGPHGELRPGERPVEDKAALIARLREALAEAEAFCQERGVDIEPILESEGFERVQMMDDAVEKIIVNDELKSKFISLATNVDRLFGAILPDTRAGAFGPRRKLFVVLAEKIQSLSSPADISAIVGPIEALLDESTSAHPLAIKGREAAPYDLSRIDFEELQRQFAHGRKRTEAERLRGAISERLQHMIRLNHSRIDLADEFRRMIDEYNAGSRDVEALFKALVEFTQRLNEEERRAVTENLSEEELAIFDILARPGPRLTKKQTLEVKRIARELLTKLVREKLVLDWRKRQQSRAAVQVLIEDMVWQLPKPYSETMCQEKSSLVYEHVYDHYWGAGQSVYAMTG